MPSAPLSTAEDLRPGDVLLVAVKLVGKSDGKPFWWRSFRVVTETRGKLWATLLILKMNPDLERDLREEQIVFTPERVFTKLEDHEMPPGVAAMLMKAVHSKLVELD